MILRLLVPAALLLAAATLPLGPVGDDARAKELLAQFAGTWDTESSYMGSPASKGTETVELLPHGLSAVVTSKSPMGPGRSFEGHGLFGYDASQKKWIHAWVDNADSHFSVSEGTWSADGKVFTIEEEIDMGTGPTLMLMQTTFSDADHARFRMAPKDAAAEAQPMVSMSYTRHGTAH
jgi:hypothetical protein